MTGVEACSVGAVAGLGFQGRDGLGAVTDLKSRPIRVKCRSREMPSCCWVSSPGSLLCLVVGAELSPYCEMRRHINHVLCGGDELLGNQIAEPCW